MHVLYPTHALFVAGMSVDWLYNYRDCSMNDPEKTSNTIARISIKSLLASYHGKLNKRLLPTANVFSYTKPFPTLSNNKQV